MRITKKQTVQWTLKVDADIDAQLKKFMQDHGKINKTALVEMLVSEYIQKNKNSQ